MVHLSALLLSFSMATLLYATPGVVSVATAQYHLEGNLSHTAFMAKISDMAEKADAKGAEVLVLPEFVTLDRWPKDSKLTDRQIVELIADQTNAGYIDLLKTLAKRHDLIILGGSTGLREGGRIYNSAPLVFPDGKIVWHRKVHLTNWEKERSFAAGENVTVVETKFGRIAILTCYDSEFPDLSLQLVKEKPDIILVPSMTESPAGRLRVLWAAQARAVEHTAFAVVSNTVGETSADWKNFGIATILSPQISELDPVYVQGDGKTHSLVVSKIDIGALHKARLKSPWQPSRVLRDKKSNLLTK